VSRRGALLLWRAVWLGLLIWPYAVASGMPRPLLLALLPSALALAAGPGARRAALRWAAALALGLSAVLPTFDPGALRAAILAGGAHSIAVTVTGILLWLTSLLGWQVFAEATARSRLLWLWLMGTLVLALNRRIWGVGADLPTLGFLGLGVVLLAVGGDDEPVPWAAVPLAALPVLGLALAALWPQAPVATTPPGHYVRGLAGLRVAVSGAALPGKVDVNQPVTLSPAPLLVVRGAPQPTYWQEATFDTFNGVDWLEPPGPRLPLSTRSLPSPLWPPDVTGLPESTWRVQVQEVLPGSIAPLIYTGTPLGLTAETALTGGTFQPAAHALLLPGTASYTWELSVPSQPSSLLQSARDLPAGQAPAKDLAVPALLRRELGPLARTLAQGGGGPWALAQRIALYLEAHETYSPAFAPSRRDDPIGRFLLRSHKGYCDQFSTAFIMLARLDGLPARWVVGFAPGLWNGKDRIETLRAEDAHSWAEIDVAPYGWVRVDPTPGAGARPTHEPAPPAARSRGAQGAALQLAAALLLLIALVLAARIVTVRRRAGWRLRRLERDIARLARGQPSGHATWREQTLALPEAARQAAWPALELLEAAHYGERRPDGEELRRAEAGMRQARRAMRR